MLALHPADFRCIQVLAISDLSALYGTPTERELWFVLCYKHGAPPERKESMQFSNAPVAKAEMQIRKPVAEVFEAFVDPNITSKFWFTKGSARLEAGKQVQWDWEMYKLSVQVNVIEVEPNKRIVVEWSAYAAPTTIEWIFKALPDNTTFVSIANEGFTGDGDAIIKQATDSTEGFAFVLAGLKALLEHNIELNLVRDRLPAGLQES